MFPCLFILIYVSFFHNRGFLNAYISYISETSDVCLLLLSTSKEDFFALQDFKKKVLERMEVSGWVNDLDKAVKDLHYAVPSLGVCVCVCV